MESRLALGAGRRAVLLSGLLWAALIGGPALAADMSSLGIETAPPPAAVIQPGPTTYIAFPDEVRVGVYAHNWIHDENSPVDVSGEILTSPIGYPNNIGGQWFSWFFNPRINVGAMINTGGKTSYGFAGLTWRIPIYKGFFFEGEFGGAVNTSPVARRAGPGQHRLPLGLPRIGRLRLPVQRALGSHRQRRAHFAREPVHAVSTRGSPRSARG